MIDFKHFLTEKEKYGDSSLYTNNGIYKTNQNDNKSWLWFMMFNATFNNISVILCRLILLVEEIGVPGVNHRPVASLSQSLSYNVVHLAQSKIRTHISMVICSDHIGSCKSNYHPITTKKRKKAYSNLYLPKQDKIIII